MAGALCAPRNRMWAKSRSERVVFSLGRVPKSAGSRPLRRCKRFRQAVESRRKPVLRFVYRAPLAQLDRASGYEPEGREFESLRARHSFHAVAKKFPTSGLGRLGPTSKFNPTLLASRRRYSSSSCVCEYLSVVRKEECRIHCFCKSLGVPFLRSIVTRECRKAC